MSGGGGRAPPARRQPLFSRSKSINKRAPPASRHQQFLSKSDSIKKRTGAATKGSKRARLRAGLAAVLQDLRLAGRRDKRSLSPVPTPGAGPATRTTRLGEPQLRLQLAARRGADAAAAAPPRGTTASSSPPEGAAATPAGGGALLLVLLLLALVSVVALGRAPAVCCCTCGALWCGGTSATATGSRSQATHPPERRALK